MPDQPELSDEDLAILEFARRRYRHEGAKERAIRDEFSMTSTAYYQRLNQLLEQPAAALAEPALIRQLRAIRDARVGRKTRSSLPA